MKPDFPRPAVANYALGVLLAAYILSFIDRQILSLLVEPIRRDLDITDFQMSLLQGLAFGLFYAILGIPIGRLADTKNRKIIIAVGVFFWSIMTAACGLARTYGILFLARMGVGVGEATLSPSAYSILSDSYPPNRLARANSIFTMGITLGSGIAYILGGTVLGLISDADPVSIPVAGELKPWQLAFMIVAAPGLLMTLLVMSIREPKRQGLIKSAEGTAAEVSTRDVLTYMKARWRIYGSIFSSVAVLGILGYGFLNWYPTFMIRTYGMEASEVGLHFGAVYLIFGTAGAFGGALLSEFLSKRGYEDANPRSLMIVAMALIPMAVGTLMPTPHLALIAAAPTVFLLNAFFGVSVAAVQVITPNQMRAVMMAIFLFLNTLVGLGFGASFVAFFTDFVFGDDMALRYSIAVTALITCPFSTTVAWLGLKHYRKTLAETNSWS
jgi:MFS family permease